MACASRVLPSMRRGEDQFAVDLDARLGTHVKRTEQALMAAKAATLRPFGLSVAQYAVLMALFYVPGRSSAQLARIAAVTPQTMSGVLDNLAGKGLVSRTPSSVHGKVLVTTLTRQGEELVQQADVQARAVEQRLADAFSPVEVEQLRDLLARATRVLAGPTDQ